MTRSILAVMFIFSFIAAACSLGSSGTGVRPSPAASGQAPGSVAVPQKAATAIEQPFGPALIVAQPACWVLKKDQPEKPAGGMSLAFEHVGTYAHMSVTAVPSERIRSLKAEAYTIYTAYAMSGMKVGPLQSDLDGLYARFVYSGTRDGIPVKGALMVYRLQSNPGYTVKLQGEWLPDVNGYLLADFDEFASGIRVE